MVTFQHWFLPVFSIENTELKSFFLSEIQQQYEGYLNTPLLWSGINAFDIEQFELTSHKTTVFSESSSKNLRLGKLVERFVSHELKQHSSIKVIVENLQIQKNQQTIGEIDCILKHENQLVHLEIVYKFYLYDPDTSDEINRWIGPNKRDSLSQKLNKLTNKQFPLLFHQATKKYLNLFDLDPHKITQKVLFKAQLFVPLGMLNNTFDMINNQCISGCYVRFEELTAFESFKFYIPSKRNWLCNVSANTRWISYQNFTIELQSFLAQKFAPLCWLKRPNGEMSKFFVVWW